MSIAEKVKKKTRKKGRVIRITPDLVKLIAENQREKETVPAVIRRLLGFSGSVRYVLPSDVYETAAEARGVAILRAVKRKEKEVEKPLPVRIK